VEKDASAWNALFDKKKEAKMETKATPFVPKP